MQVSKGAVINILYQAHNVRRTALRSSPWDMFLGLIFSSNIVYLMIHYHVLFQSSRLPSNRNKNILYLLLYCVLIHGRITDTGVVAIWLIYSIPIKLLLVRLYVTKFKNVWEWRIRSQSRSGISPQITRITAYSHAFLKFSSLCGSKTMLEMS